MENSSNLIDINSSRTINLGLSAVSNIKFEDKKRM